MRSLLAPEVVGRELEFARLEGALERARSGDGASVWITGEAGVGKTALLRTLTARADGMDVVTARAAASPGRPLQVVGDLIVTAIAAGADAGDQEVADFRAVLTHIAPHLVGAGSRSGALPSDPLAPAVGEALLRLIGTLRSPVLVLVEDVHWADRDSVAALGYVATHVAGRPAAVVVTLRDGDRSDAMESARILERAHRIEILDLPPLTPESVAEMISACLGSATPPADLVGAVAGASRGLPLIVEELLLSLVNLGRLTASGDDWSFDDSGELPLPAGLAAMIGERLDRLPDDQRLTITLAALLGPEFDADLLRSLTPAATGAVDAALRAGMDAHLIEPAASPEVVRFRHALSCSAVLDCADPLDRHRLASQALNAVRARDPELGGHLLDVAVRLVQHTGERSYAAQLLFMAGRRALDHGVPASAVKHLEGGLAVAADDFELSLQLREHLVEALALTGEVERAGADGAELARLLTAAGAAPDRMGRTHLAMARAAGVQGHWDQARRIVAGVEPTVGKALRAEVDAFSAVVSLELGDPPGARLLAEAALAAESAGAPAVCEALEVLGRLARAEDLDLAADQFTRAVVTAERAHLALWRARALHELATIRQLGRQEPDDLLRARAAAVDAGAQSLLTAIDFHISALYGVCFESEPALEAGRRCLQRSRRLGVVRQEAMSWIVIGQAHASAGRRAQADAAAREAVALTEDDEVAGLAAGACRGLAALVNEDRPQAQAEYRVAIDHLRRLPAIIPVTPWYMWPILAALVGDGAREAIKETDRRELRITVGFNALWHLASAIHAGRTGDVRRADEFAAQAEAIFDTAPRTIGYRHLGHRLAAEAAVEDGWGEPARWLGAAEPWFELKGLVRAASACRSLLRRTGVPQRRSRGRTEVPAALADVGVTSREADVLILLAEGLTNKAIAERLYISPRTVKSHVEHLLTKTGLSSRVQLASLAIGHGLGGPISAT